MRRSVVAQALLQSIQRCRACQIELERAEAKTEDVPMRVDQAGQDSAAAAVDLMLGRAYQIIVAVDQLKDLAMRAKCAVVLSTHDERIFDVASRRLHIEDGRCFEVPIHYH